MGGDPVGDPVGGERRSQRRVDMKKDRYSPKKVRKCPEEHERILIAVRSVVQCSVVLYSTVWRRAELPVAASTGCTATARPRHESMRK